MRFTRTMAITAVLALTLGACGDDDGGEADEATPTSAAGATTSAGGATTTAAEVDDTCTEERKGGDITMGLGSVMARGIDPNMALGTGSAGGIEIGAFYDTLLRYNAESGKFEERVAASATPNADSTVWTIKLRPGIKFGNGDPLTAEAVRFSIDRMAKGTVAASGMAQEVASMKVVDDLTIELTLRQSWGGFRYFLSTEGGMIVNPTVVAAKGDQFSLDPTGGGVGPYELQRFAPNEEIILKAKTDYWDGPVCIDTIRFILVPGGQATYDAFKTGELDVAFVQELGIVPDMKKDGVTGISSINGAGATFLLNAGRGTNPPLADVNLRRAIAHAIDLKLFNDRVYGGKALASSGLVHPDQRTYPGTNGPQYDVAQAKSLVAAAKAAGYNGNITITCGDTPSAIESTITLKAMLEAVGFTVTMQNLPAAQSLQVILIEGNYQIGCGGLSLFDEGMVRGMNQFASTSVRNRVGIKDPKMDAGINQLYQAKDEAEVTKAMANLQTVWNDIVPAANVFASEWFNAYHDDVHGLVSNRDGTILFHDAWVD